MTSPNCPNCGTPLREGARFCPSCGTPYTPSPTAPKGSSRKRFVLAGIATLLVAGAAAIGFLLASDGDSGSGGSDLASAAEETAAPQESGEEVLPPGTPPPCDKEEAERQMSTGPFAEAMRRQFDFDGDPGEHFMADLVACADLTGDGEDEMVIQGFGPTGGGPVPWGILTPAEGRWELALARFTIVVRSLEIIDGTVQEVSAAYAVEDPLCCPSSERSGSLSWDGDSFGYAPDNGSPDRRIEVTSDGRPAQLGELDLRTGDLLTARALFGPPSSVSSDSLTECRAAWSDLGLRINFQDFSGNGACGAGGNVGSVEIEAGPGEQAGWALADGLGVGTSIEAVLNEYPDARHEDQDLEEECSGTPYVLRTMSFAGEVASVLVHAGQGEVECLRLNVFAAGD